MSSVTPTSSSNIRADYMNLLIVQLQNQNPLDPMDNDAMTAQLTSLSQLEQLESMKSAFDKVLEVSEAGLAQSKVEQATDLIGKYVSFFTPDSDQMLTGEVELVEFVNDEPRLVVGNYSVTMDDISAVTGELIVAPEASEE